MLTTYVVKLSMFVAKVTMFMVKVLSRSGSMQGSNGLSTGYYIYHVYEVTHIRRANYFSSKIIIKIIFYFIHVALG